MKDAGRFEVGFGQSAHDYINQDDETDLSNGVKLVRKGKEALGAKGWAAFSERWNSIAGYLPGKMDAVTWGRMWEAVKL